MTDFSIRPAIPDDWPTIAQFNIHLAEETEGKPLDPDIIGPGVQAVLADERKGRYFVACREGEIVGQLMHTFEWSDWRNGNIWWLQSVYVAKNFRRLGVFRQLYQHLATAAAEAEAAAALIVETETVAETPVETAE